MNMKIRFIEVSGEVHLQDGFIVEPGATFAVYPSCFWMISGGSYRLTFADILFFSDVILPTYEANW